MVLQLVFEAVEVFGQLVFETQVLADFVIALTNQVPRGRKVEALGGEVVGAVEEVGKLRLFGIALAGGGNDDDLAVLVGFNDGLDLLELAGIGDRAAAELAYDSLTHFFLSGHQTSQLRAQSLSSRPSCPSLPIWPATLVSGAPHIARHERLVRHPGRKQLQQQPCNSIQPAHDKHGGANTKQRLIHKQASISCNTRINMKLKYLFANGSVLYKMNKKRSLQYLVEYGPTKIMSPQHTAKEGMENLSICHSLQDN